MSRSAASRDGRRRRVVVRHPLTRSSIGDVCRRWIRLRRILLSSDASQPCMASAAFTSGPRPDPHVAVTDEQAREELWPRYLQVIRHVSETRGFAIPTEDSFLFEVGPQGALYVGSPETVAHKIADNLTGATRFDLKYGMGGLPHEALLSK